MAASVIRLTDRVPLNAEREHRAQCFAAEFFPLPRRGLTLSLFNCLPARKFITPQSAVIILRVVDRRYVPQVRYPIIVSNAVDVIDDAARVTPMHPFPNDSVCGEASAILARKIYVPIAVSERKPAPHLPFPKMPFRVDEPARLSIVVKPSANHVQRR